MKKFLSLILMILLIFTVSCKNKDNSETSNSNNSENSSNSNSNNSSGGNSEEKEELTYTNTYENQGKVGISFVDYGTVERVKPIVKSNGLDYPLYNVSNSYTDDEKQAILDENITLIASTSTYDSMDSDGNLYLNGEKTGNTLFKHEASDLLYNGVLSDGEPAIKRKVNINPRPLGNYITGLYAPAGEVIKIEISEEDLEKTGGFNIEIGQGSNRGHQNNIPVSATFSRMPRIQNKMAVTSTTCYVGSFLGGPIYIGEPKNKNSNFSVTISGGCEYETFILGLTTEEDIIRTKKSSAPYFDLEVYDDAIRHTGPKSEVEDFDFNDLLNIANFYEKISIISNKFESYSANVGIAMIYDTYITAGAAVAYVGANFCLLPISWMKGSLNYENFTLNGSWGTIHEYNHHYQNYGVPENGEVTNNAVSIIEYLLYTNISSKRTEDESSLSGWNKYTDLSFTLKDLLSYDSSKPNYTLSSYATLIHTFGPDIFIKATELQDIDQNCDDWYLSFTKASNYDMTYYFETLCHYELSESVKEEVKSMNLPMFVPVGCLYQTSMDYTNLELIRPYEVRKDSLIELDFENNFVVPEGFTYDLELSDYSGKLTKIDDLNYTYLPSSELDTINLKVTLKKDDNSFEVNPINIFLTFDSSIDNTSVKTYKLTSDTQYNNLAVAYADNYKAAESVEEYFNDDFNLTLSPYTITEVKSKVYLENSKRIYLKGSNETFLYLSLDGKVYDLVAYSDVASYYLNQTNRYYDIIISKPTYVYIKEVTLTRASTGYINLGWSDIKANPTGSDIPSKYLMQADSTFKDYTFETDYYYERSYDAEEISYSEGSSVIDYTNFEFWSDEYTFENVFDENINTYAHNLSPVTEESPSTITVDMQKEYTINQMVIYGRNNEQSHVPTSFDLYIGTSLSNLTLYKEYKDLEKDYNHVTINFDSNITLRYYKLVIEDTDTKKYLAISEIYLNLNLDDYKLLSPTSSLISYSNPLYSSNIDYFSKTIIVSDSNIKINTNKDTIILGYALEDSKIIVGDKTYDIKKNEDLSLLLSLDNITSNTILEVIGTIEVVSFAVK